jgi:hypothetical protein
MVSLTVWFILLSLYIILNVILTVAFLTLFERKVLASIQKRKGPNWTGFLGILQPLADALKLILKENPVPQNASSVLFFGGPLILLILSLSAWFVIPFNNSTVVADINIGILYVFMVSSLNTLNNSSRVVKQFTLCFPWCFAFYCSGYSLRSCDWYYYYKYYSFERFIKFLKNRLITAWFMICFCLMGTIFLVFYSYVSWD